jgi:hypothetical protein
MRRQRVAPGMVHIETSHGFDRFGVGIPHGANDPQLFIEPEDNLRTLDLRCIVGLRVKVTGNDADRVKAVAQACEAASAKRVIASTFQPIDQYPGIELVEVTDTEGVLTWRNS